MSRSIEAKRLYARERYRLKADERLAQKHLYYLANKDKRRAYNKEYYLRNRERIIADNKLYYQINPEVNRTAGKKYRASKKGKIVVKAKSHRHRARKASIPGTHTAIEIDKIIARGARCHICGKKFTKLDPPTIDHVLAVSHELGSNDAGNLAPSHLLCNVTKQDSRFNPITGQGLLI